MKPQIAGTLCAVAAIGLLSACHSYPSQAAAMSRQKAMLILFNASESSGISLVEQLSRMSIATFRDPDPDKDRRGLAESATRDRMGAYDSASAAMQRAAKDFSDQVVVDAVEPIYRRYFLPEELDDLVGFASTPAGADALSRAWGEKDISVIVAGSPPAAQAEVRDFLNSPTGRKYVSLSRELRQQSITAIQELWQRRKPDLDRQFSTILARMQPVMP